jgi:hypothetical protein
MNKSINIEPFSNNYIIVYADKNKFMKKFIDNGGEWVDKLSGWLFPKSSQSKIERLINIIKNTSILENLSNNCNKKNKSSTYHRSISDNEESDNEENEESDNEDLINTNVSKSKKKYLC